MHIGASIGRTALPSQITAFDHYARQIEELGLDAVEIDFSIRGNFPNFAPLPYPGEDVPDWAELRRRIDTLAIAGAHLPYADLNPLSEDEDIAEDARIQHMDAIERAGDLGLLYAVVHMLGYRVNTDRDTWFPLWIDYLGDLSDFARRAGLVLCVENTSYGFFLGDLVRIVNAVHSPWLRITLDTGHALIPGSRTARLVGCPHLGYDSMEAFVRREHDKLFSLHLHDNDGQTDQHLPIGDGVGDFGYLAALHETGFNGPWIMEHIIDDWHSIGRAARRLRNLTRADDA
jgi:sugar phosphate isomerase/epimerase